MSNVISIKKMPPTQHLLAVSEAAKYVGMSRNTLIKKTEDGEIRAYVVLARRMYRVEDLNHWLDSLPQWQPQKKRTKGQAVE